MTSKQDLSACLQGRCRPPTGRKGRYRDSVQQRGGRTRRCPQPSTHLFIKRIVQQIIRGVILYFIYGVIYFICIFSRNYGRFLSGGIILGLFLKDLWPVSSWWYYPRPTSPPPPTMLMVSLLRDTMAKICKWVRRRIEGVMEAGGHFFK
jgi:hypothetical protein